ncbi:type I toxin-antitoxin system Ibs family toxin [Escherichia coli]
MEGKGYDEFVIILVVLLLLSFPTY